MVGPNQSVKVAIFSTRNYDREFLSTANAARHEIHFFEPHLNETTASLAAGFGAVCVFVNDHVNAAVIATLASLGVRLVALRCAGYNNVDVTAAKKPALACISTKLKANGKRKSFYECDNHQPIVAAWG
jgi:D-lactate dehydrogenase